MRNALVLGITGQDGSLLSKFLLDKGYKVYGVMRRSSSPNPWRLNELGITGNKNLIILRGDLSDSSSIDKIMKYAQYDEIYNLAAQSFVGNSWDMPFYTLDVTGIGAVRIFESAKNYQKKTKIYQASSSEMFGGADNMKFNEKSTFNPKSPYASAKVLAHNMAHVYRESYEMFISCGILFNHESEYRGLEFVTRKITNGVAKIKLGLIDKIYLGNLKSSRDWGYAPDYVEGMWGMLQNDCPDDFVLATGKSYSIAYLCKVAFNCIGISDWINYVESTAKYFRPNEVNALLGDYTKANMILGWSPKINFEQMIQIMIGKDIERLKNE